MQYFRHDERDFVKKMRFYVVRVQFQSDTPVNFYHRYSDSQMLSQSPFFAMFLEHDTYQNLKQPAFLFDKHIDCFSYEDHMFILQKNNFFQIFNIGELEKVAREVLDKLEKKDFIHNFQDFKKDCLGDKNKILKLRNIASSPYVDTLTIEDLHKTVRRYPELQIQVDLVRNKKKLVYDPKQRWAILHVLDDAYADSSMTSYSYFIKGKRQIRRK